jgi:hypothetical protein
MLWLGHRANIDAATTGLLVSLVASLAACFAIARLTDQIGGRGRWGVLAWALSPIAVFAVAPWSEALFCALAFWAWVTAREGRWLAAGLLATAASLSRANGIFLAIALCTMFLTSGPRTWSRAWPLALPFAAVLTFFGYLWAITGNPTAWFAAQAQVWNRSFTLPWTSLRNTYDLIFTFTSPSGEGAPHSRFIIEIVAVAVLVLFLVVLLFKRWWAESVYVALTLFSMTTGVFFQSVPRSFVVLFPVWMLLGLWLSKRRALLVVYTAVMMPALFVVTMRFAQGQWIS